ncbi:chromate transporter [Youngiibacter multivorans]|uniref:Chromate transporter n=1 Tax=Youngiibacter multivorans TaxID=937251 RepID=A0ABS4G852_9CLOT|nr:chromate transporter [Youngiibacter multivorans]MBP1920731.1 chromate transporter [Youngiibacter multivorans]
MKLLLEMFISFFKIGAFTIGGGYAMLPLIQKEVVENKKWIGEEDFLDMVAISQSAPGPIAVNISVFVGNKIKGIKGMAATVLGATLPSFLIIILVASVFIGIEKHPIVARVFMGIRPAVVALIAAPVIKMAKTAKMDRKNFYIPLSAVILVGFLGVTPIYVIIGLILFGIITTYIRRRMK